LCFLANKKKYIDPFRFLYHNIHTSVVCKSSLPFGECCVWGVWGHCSMVLPWDVRSYLHGSPLDFSKLRYFLQNICKLAEACRIETCWFTWWMFVFKTSLCNVNAKFLMDKLGLYG
jgi:hypothetical protein